MTLMIISPHADDETLGAGGTILKYKENGYRIVWLNIANIKEIYGYNKEDVEEKQRQIDLVRDAYQIDEFIDLGLRPAFIDEYSTKELVEKISKLIYKNRPEILLLPFCEDVHSDHKVVWQAAYACTKSFRYNFIKKVLSMEILSETNFVYYDNGFLPNYYVDITKYLKKKISIMKIYKNELGVHPFPRSIECIEALALLRGSEAGVKYAEAFKCVKTIEK